MKCCNTVYNTREKRICKGRGHLFFRKIYDIMFSLRSGKGEEQSSILCRPCGKGLVVIFGELYGNALPFLVNILAYSQEVKR